MMLRSFFPIGQGAFYLEQFKTQNQRINVVYDCGSSTPEFDIKKEIRSNFNKDEEILIVFISHLHEDHVNGLEYLMDYCNVKNIVFPFTYPEDRILMSIEYLCTSKKHDPTDSVYRLIDNPSEFIRHISPNTNLYAVNSENENSNDNRQDLYNQAEMDRVRILNSGEDVFHRIWDENIKVIKKSWEYVPFNFKNDIRKDLFYNALSLNLGVTIDDTNIRQYLAQWSNPKIQKIFLEAYKEVNKYLNVNSMTLFSGTKDFSIRQRMIIPYKKYFCKCCWQPKRINRTIYRVTAE
ncbi:MAG: MBL fold metallo-hydrolase [Ruminococcus sp.]|nr:MBL fold metallo-hydrolase [Ruminococcus sp.]